MANRIDYFAREIDRIFNDVQRTPAGVAMPMDLYRQGENFIVRIDMPGVDPASIDVNVEDGALTVTAERGAPVGSELQWLTHERATGTFARQLTVGRGVALDRIEADYTDGVLTLRVPVAEEAKPRKVSVMHRGSQQVVEGATSGASHSAAVDR